MNLNRFIKSIVSRLEWTAEDFLWFVLKPYYKYGRSPYDRNDFAIGITTYKDRYHPCLRPLLNKAGLLFPEARIIIAANGHYDRKSQSVYMKKIERFCRRFNNVSLITFNDPVGLSKMWNTIIDQAGRPVVLIMNDDVKIGIRFRKFMDTSGILKDDIATINSSWSHYVISQKTVSMAGKFDEGFKEIGGEDDDYLARLAIDEIEANDYQTHTLISRRFRDRKGSVLNSFGKDMSKERGGYSTLNSNYLEKKWEVRSSPFPGSVRVAQRNGTYWKPRTGTIS